MAADALTTVAQGEIYLQRIAEVGRSAPVRNSATEGNPGALEIATRPSVRTASGQADAADEDGKVSGLKRAELDLTVSLVGGDDHAAR
jgi:hypothetical protein